MYVYVFTASILEHRNSFIWANKLRESDVYKLEQLLKDDGQNTDPQSMDYPNGLPKWTTLKWTTPKNTISDECYIKKLRFYTSTAQIDLHIFVPHGLQPPF